jgi:hypothetical protein
MSIVTQPIFASCSDFLCCADRALRNAEEPRGAMWSNEAAPIYEAEPISPRYWAEDLARMNF